MRVTNLVESILRENISARSSDRELFIEFMKRNGLLLNDAQEARFRNMPSLETARRIRQKVQQQGKYPADPHIKKERSHKSMVLGQAAPVYQPKHIENTLEQAELKWWEGIK